MCVAYSGMGALPESSRERWRLPLMRWMDGIEEGWAIPLMLAGFVTVWQAFLVIAYADGDLHPDVLETWTLGRSIAWGYSKHPPLMGWTARAWTTIFPLANWSFQLMALANAAIALWIVDLISRHFVSGDKRLVVLLLLMLLPTYQFHAQRFNANTILLATWPLATYCFLRSFETRQVRWAVAAGVTAALAMLGKYYSAFLIGSFALAAMCHPMRRAYFASPAPWVSIATGALALAPHLYWLILTGAQPIAYAFERHGGKDVVPSMLEATQFILGIAMVLALPAAIWVLIAGNRLKQVAGDFCAMSSGLLLLFFVSVGTILLPAGASIALGTDMPPIWGLQGLFLFAILVVCGASYPIERISSLNLAALVILITTMAAFVVAPVHAFYRNVYPLHEGRNFYRLSAEELTRQWHRWSESSLPAVGGDEDLAFALAFYSPDHPQYEERLVNPGAKSLPDSDTLRRGWAALCFGEDAACIAAAERSASQADRLVKSEFELQSSLLGQVGARQRFAAIMALPSAGRPVPDGGLRFSAIRRTRQNRD
jgi:4-amino-4-deoxy-L-arabinose transferase-like glycosyltransferase